eukprot:scaffold34685_cov183-Amphora_coffeaeformis.AAC.31
MNGYTLLLAKLFAVVAIVDGFQSLPTKSTIASSTGQANLRLTAATRTTPRVKEDSTYRAFGLSSRHIIGKSAIQNNRSRHSSSQLYASIGGGGENNYDYTCDVLVLGSGPAARSIASLLGANELKVILADQNEDRDWPPNYGVWQDEWQAILDAYAGMGVTLDGGNQGQCVDRAWPVTDCYFGGSFDIPTEARMRLDRPYYRVDRFALRQSLMAKGAFYETVRANHKSRAIGVNMYEPAGSLSHDSEGSTIALEKKNGDQVVVRSKLIVDCTGHETRLVLKESRDTSPKPGFQIAYGMLVDVDKASFRNNAKEIGPYDVEAMTLFDYRTDHYDTADDGAKEKVAKSPTFMYGACF